MIVRHAFNDIISGQDCTLIIDTSRHWYKGGVTAEHPGCGTLADVSPDLDALYCGTCRFNGRVSGAWVVDMVDAAHEAAS